MTVDLDSIYCGRIKRGDIFLVRDEGERTVVVVQDDILNERLSSVLVVPVEPQKAGESVFKNELLLTRHETGFGRAGLCRPYHLRAVDRHHMVAKRGELSRTRLSELLAVLDINLGRFRD